MSMPVLTRRRSPDAQQETWLVYYGDVHIGTISERAGVYGASYAGQILKGR